MNSCLSSVWLFFAMIIGASFTEARSLRMCDALSSLSGFGNHIKSIQKEIAPPVTVESTLDVIHNSYGFFNFPIFDEGTPRLKEVCPNFKVMNRADKEKFWRNFWTQLAHHESSGEMKKNEEAHEGAACGYLQLHCELKKRNLSIRADFRKHCSGQIYFDPQNPEKNPLTSPLTVGANNFKCGMAMLQNQVDNTNEIFPDKSKQNKVYWMPLQKPQQMYLNICNYKGCGNTPGLCQELVKKRKQELQ